MECRLESVPGSITYSVFAHLNADKVDRYRAVLGVFTTARERFVIALRPADVVVALEEGSRSLSTQALAPQFEVAARPPGPNDVPAIAPRTS